mmetsp:Transcript_44352/g.80913  ORF Transcript_44352/g.80913 Transcript_44352/m.80913 type:complete len:214 (+) Transcript_44352:221-862(+)
MLAMFTFRIESQKGPLALVWSAIICIISKAKMVIAMMDDKDVTVRLYMSFCMGSTSAQLYVASISKPLIVSTKHMPHEKAIGMRVTIQNGRASLVPVMAAKPSKPTCVAVSKPSPNKKPTKYIFSGLFTMEKTFLKHGMDERADWKSSCPFVSSASACASLDSRRSCFHVFNSSNVTCAFIRPTARIKAAENILAHIDAFVTRDPFMPSVTHL